MILAKLIYFCKLLQMTELLTIGLTTIYKVLHKHSCKNQDYKAKYSKEDI